MIPHLSSQHPSIIRAASEKERRNGTLRLTNSSSTPLPLPALEYLSIGPPMQPPAPYLTLYAPIQVPRSGPVSYEMVPYETALVVKSPPAPAPRGVSPPSAGTRPPPLPTNGYSPTPHSPLGYSPPRTPEPSKTYDERIAGYGCDSPSEYTSPPTKQDDRGSCEKDTARMLLGLSSSSSSADKVLAARELRHLVRTADDSYWTTNCPQVRDSRVR